VRYKKDLEDNMKSLWDDNEAKKYTTDLDLYELLSKNFNN
jgi:hypothetical protein